MAARSTFTGGSLEHVEWHVRLATPCSCRRFLGASSDSWAWPGSLPFHRTMEFNSALTTTCVLCTANHLITLRSRIIASELDRPSAYVQTPRDGFCGSRCWSSQLGHRRRPETCARRIRAACCRCEGDGRSCPCARPQHRAPEAGPGRIQVGYAAAGRAPAAPQRACGRPLQLYVAPSPALS